MQKAKMNIERAKPMRYPGGIKTAANPSFRPTLATTETRRMEMKINAVLRESKQTQKRMRAMEAAERARQDAAQSLAEETSAQEAEEAPETGTSEEDKVDE